MGMIDISVEDGVVTLDSDVPVFGLKRLAGVPAWWVPGSRDVVNGLGVIPPEEVNDDTVKDAVRLALEKGPLVDPDQIMVTTYNAVVTLHEVLPAQAEREMAEFDPWYVFGVDRAVNEILVRAGEGYGDQCPAGRWALREGPAVVPARSACAP